MKSRNSLFILLTIIVVGWSFIVIPFSLMFVTFWPAFLVWIGWVNVLTGKADYHKSWFWGFSVLVTGLYCAAAIWSTLSRYTPGSVSVSICLGLTVLASVLLWADSTSKVRPPRSRWKRVVQKSV